MCSSDLWNRNSADPVGSSCFCIWKDFYRSWRVWTLPCDYGRAESDRAKTGWKADGVITGDYAAVYADWLKIFWNYRPVCGAASGFISKTVE